MTFGNPDAFQTRARIKASQHAVRQLLLVHGPMTDQQMVAEYNGRVILPKQSDSGLRSRRAELVAMKPPLVRWTGRWHREPKKRRAKIWEAIEKV